MAKVHHVKSARKPNPAAGIEIGDSYYWWQLYKRPKQYSKTYPKPSQLTQSEFLIQIYDWHEQGVIEYSEGLTETEISAAIQELVSEIGELRDETQEKYDNMPEQLQCSATGELLEQRVLDLDIWINELESKESEWDDDMPEEDKEEFISELNEIQYEGN